MLTFLIASKALKNSDISQRILIGRKKKNTMKKQLGWQDCSAGNMLLMYKPDDLNSVPQSPQ